MVRVSVSNCCPVRLAILVAIGAGVFACCTAGAKGNNRPDVAEPDPVSKGRIGKWRWPRSGGGDGVVGNRGRVFGTGDETIEELDTAEIPPPPPEPTEPPVCGPRGPILQNILFAADSVALRPEGRIECDKIVKELQNFPGDTAIFYGHTDDTGSVEYNLALGERRAQAVKDYIVSRGVAAERIAILSKGEREPAVPNNSPANRALNRRVTFAIKLGS